MEEMKQRLSHRAELTSYELLTECTDESMKDVVKLVDTAKNTRSILILGENGTGKELVARAIQERGERKGKPFETYDCTNLSADVLRSDLFGHERGAYTGSIGQRIGLFERVNGGTVFLDEIGEIPLDLQSKLLRVLQGKTFTRMGGDKEIKSEFNLIAATNRDLPSMVEQGKFREDLYYRIEVLTINLPPLRERMEDSVRLANHFLSDISGETKVLSVDAEKAIQDHSWPGNVRELKNAIERSVILSNGFGRVEREHLRISKNIVKQVEQATNLFGKSFEHLGLHDSDLEQIMDVFLRGVRKLSTEEFMLAGGGLLKFVEACAIRAVYRAAGGNKLKTAMQLGIGRQTLYNKLFRYGQFAEQVQRAGGQVPMFPELVAKSSPKPKDTEENVMGL